MVAIADLLGKVKRPVRSAWVCLDGELWSRHDDLSRQIDALRAQSPGKMADADGVAPLSRELHEVEQAMRAAEVEFKFRGCSTYKMDEIQEKYPAKDGNGWDTVAGGHELLAACGADPEMTPDEAKQLLGELHQAAGNKLFRAAWIATTGSADVPFSGRASASTSATGPK